VLPGCMPFVLRLPGALSSRSASMHAVADRDRRRGKQKGKVDPKWT